MALTTEQLRRYRSIFAWLFVISAVLLVVAWVYLLNTAPTPANEGPSSAGGIFAIGSEGVTLPFLVAVASLLTSVASLAGFFTTTTLALRKEEREQQQAALDLEQTRLEIEKLRRELEGKDVPDQGK